MREPSVERRSIVPAGGWLCLVLSGLGAMVASGRPGDQEPLQPAAAPAPAATRDEIAFFENRIRPLLDAHCYECHGPARPRVKGGLRILGRQSLIEGGESGPAIVPGDVERSELIERVRYTTSEYGMPPKGKLTPQAIEDFERWVGMGAPWPDGEGGPAVRDDEPRGVDYASGRAWWSFRPVLAPQPPTVEHASEVRDPLDAFVFERLEAEGLEPNPRADERELVRRAYFDVIGLPPTREQVDDYVSDVDPQKWPRLVDRLLADPAYGERWARFWLDLVRYAETNGYERDTPKPYAWRYRDWVVQAMRDDLRFDEFLRWQIAGDELEPLTPEKLTATGFYRVGPWDDEPDDPEKAIQDELDDAVRTIGEGFLGLTVGCARCHDHKFDPIAQRDYYGMVAFLRNLRPYEQARFALDSPTLRMLDTSVDAAARWEAQRARRIDDLQLRQQELLRHARAVAIEKLLPELPPELRAAISTPEDRRSPEQAEAIASAPELVFEDAKLEQALERKDRRALRALRVEMEGVRSNSFEGDVEWALCARESGAQLAPTRLYVRGDVTAPGPEVEPHFPPVACEDDAAAIPHLPTPESGAQSSGARSALANWIVDPKNPLTARVIVNRVWQQHFGRGLVATPNDFGRTGEAPTHPELLDHLAATFMADGWSLRRLHRRILLSATWQRSSRAANAAAIESDPGNLWLWRQNVRQLEAEALRDSMLFAAGTLDRSAGGGPSFYPRLSSAALAGASRPGEGWGITPDAELSRRSVYAYVKRTLPVPFFATFDAADSSLPIGRRMATNLATQSMTLLNDEFANQCAAALAERVRRESTPRADARERISRAFELALGRRPTEREVLLASQYLSSLEASLKDAQPKLAFQWRVPTRLANDYLERASGEDLIFGPRVGWSYFKGRWSGGYNATQEFELDHGPGALLMRPAFADGSIDLTFRFESEPGFVAIALRASQDPEDPAVLRGLELRFVPGASSVELWRVDASGAERLASATCILEAGAPNFARLSLNGDRLEAFVGAQGLSHGGQPSLACALPAEPATGQFGVRTSGEAVELERLVLSSGTERLELRADDPGPPQDRALESLCLSLFNLNEFLYID